jgi:hypothetical protein
MPEHKADLSTIFLGLIVSILVVGGPLIGSELYKINGRLIRLETVIQSSMSMHEKIHDNEIRIIKLEQR